MVWQNHRIASEMQFYKNEDEFMVIQRTSDTDRFKNSGLTREEKMYLQKSNVFVAYTELNEAFEQNNKIEIWKSITNLKVLLNCKKKDVFPQLIPENKLELLIKIFFSFQDNDIKESMLELFSILITLSDKTNDNMSMMINNSFLQVVLKFRDDIRNLKKRLKIVNLYLEVIHSLILFCVRNVNSSDSENIIKWIDFDFIISLFELVQIGIGNQGERKQWLRCIRKYLEYYQQAKILINFNLFPNFLNLFKSLLNEKCFELHYYSRVILTLTKLIDSYPEEGLNWDEFIKLDYPRILLDFTKEEDYEIIRIASDCIISCTRHKFYAFEFEIDNIFNSVKEFECRSMYQSLFCAYCMVASNVASLVDDFFTNKTIVFLHDISDYAFKFKKEIAIFIAQMLEYANSVHTTFIVETCEMLIFLYQIYFDSMDNEILTVLLQSLPRIGHIFTSQYSSEALTQIFSQIVPENFIEILNQIDDENISMSSQFILQNFPFFFGVFN